MRLPLRTSFLSVFAPALLLAPGLVACTAQAGPDYEGEVVASVDGLAESELATPPESIEAALVWANLTRWDHPRPTSKTCSGAAGGGDTGSGEEPAVRCKEETGPGGAIVFERVRVEGEFPARFRLDLFGPPAEESLNDLGPVSSTPGEESRFGIAVMVALEPGQYPDGIFPLTGEGAEELDEMGPPLGLAEHHVLAYVERDVEPGTETAQFLGGPLSAGYHILDIVAGPDGTGELTLSAEDMDTEVRVRLADPESLDFPDLDFPVDS